MKAKISGLRKQAAWSNRTTMIAPDITGITRFKLPLRNELFAAWHQLQATEDSCDIDQYCTDRRGKPGSTIPTMRLHPHRKRWIAGASKASSDPSPCGTSKFGATAGPDRQAGGLRAQGPIARTARDRQLPAGYRCDHSGSATQRKIAGTASGVPAFFPDACLERMAVAAHVAKPRRQAEAIAPWPRPYPRCIRSISPPDHDSGTGT